MGSDARIDQLEGIVLRAVYPGSDPMKDVQHMTYSHENLVDVQDYE